MSVHIFQVSEDNYDTCLKKGIVALHEPKPGKNEHAISEALLSRMSVISDGDYILMYVTKSKQLRGVWQADGGPFYEDTKIWEDGIYPYRCRIKWSNYRYTENINLNDITDLVNCGKLWSWALASPGGRPNSMFSISNAEFRILLHEFDKANPFASEVMHIQAPTPYHSNNIADKLSITNGKPQYEYTIMAHLGSAFANKKYCEIFGNYSDFLCYVPTSLGREIDILLMFESPNTKELASYDVIEVKHKEFDKSGLEQLISYESWLLNKKVYGDMKMLRTTAIASSFSDEVVTYVKQRGEIEHKKIKLLQYSIENGSLSLQCIN